MQGLVLLGCVCMAIGAPTLNKEKEIQELQSIKNTEKEIEELADLAAESGTHSVGIEKQKSFSFHNYNGKVDSKSKAESKVYNPETGKLISDLQQETLGPDGSKTKTKIDIPAANIHKSLIGPNDDDVSLPKMDYDYSEAFKFTPAAVADYLFRSGEFEELEEALADLVNSSIMTQQQADTYREDVRKEYNMLVQRATAANTEQNDRFLSDYSNLNDIYRMFGYSDVIPHLGIDALQSKEIMRLALSRATSLIEVIRTLMDEWLTKATITGDPDAAALLGDILRQVSKDSDPDDLSQMREILYDIFANEVLNSLEKRPPGNYEVDESVFGIPEEDQTENKSESSKQKVDTKGQKEQSENTEIPEEKTAKTVKEDNKTVEKSGDQKEHLKM
ncbi:uncharacterized protein LOC111115901 isoform X2 [Crassostrea virginica]